MPRKDFHDILEKLLFGKLTGMSGIMDGPAQQGLGSHHRILYHDPLQIALISLLKGGDFTTNFLAGMLHTTVDVVMSESGRAVKKFIKKQSKGAKSIDQ